MLCTHIYHKSTKATTTQTSKIPQNPPSPPSNPPSPYTTQIVKALRFYFGGPGVTDRIAQELYNINTTAVAAINSTMQPVRDWLESPQGTVFLRSVPQASQALQDLQNLRGELQAVLANTSFVEDAVKQSDFQTIFQVCFSMGAVYG